MGRSYLPSSEILSFGLDLRLIHGVVVKNENIDLKLKGDLQFTGTNERPGLLGSLSLEPGGRLNFVGREYQSLGGLVQFTERTRFDTQYDVSFQTSACDALIQVDLKGGMQDVSTRYSSSPDMPQEDISSCIVRGIRRRDLDQDLASFAGSAFLKLSGVDRQVKRVIPIDQIDVTTEFSTRTRSYEPRVLIAKEIRLLRTPVRLEYSTSLVSDDEQRTALRLRLSPELSLRLGWASTEDVPLGDWGIDLQRRWVWGAERGL